MEKVTAKVFKKYAPKKKLTIVKDYRAMTHDEHTPRTIGVKCSRMILRVTLANLLMNANKRERTLVAKALNATMREDSTEDSGMYVFY